MIQATRRFFEPLGQGGNFMIWRSLATTLIVGFLVSPVSAGTSNSLLDVSPDGKYLLAANADNSSVSVVDTAAGKVVHEIKVGDKPEGVTWIGAGPLAAVACYREGKVVFFDAMTGKIVSKLAVAPEPYGIVADPKGKRVWVTHEYPGIVSEIDVAKRKVIRELKAGSMVRGLALSPDEKRVYVSEFTPASSEPSIWNWVK